MYLSYLNRLGLKKGTLEVKLAEFVRDYDYHQINEHLLLNEFKNLNHKEVELIKNKIEKFRKLSADDIIHYRKTFRDLCEAEIINKSNEFPNPTDRLNFIRETDYKDQFSRNILIESFEEASSRGDDPLNRSGIKSHISLINECSPVGEYLSSLLVAVTAAPGIGKSNFLMNESISACLSGKRVHYLAAGDLVPTDFLIRMSAQALKIPIKDIYLNAPYYIEQTEKLLGGRFKFSCVPSQSITADEYVNYMMSIADQFDMFVIDYDTNIATTSDSMYGAGGELYDLLTKLSRLGKLVFVASQPKIGFYDHDKIPMQGLAESSRKQQIIDMQITLGRSPKSGYKTGYISVVKNRRGSTGSRPYVISSSLVAVEIQQSKYDLHVDNPLTPSDHQISYEYLVTEANYLDLDSMNYPQEVKDAIEDHAKKVKEAGDQIFLETKKELSDSNVVKLDSDSSLENSEKLSEVNEVESDNQSIENESIEETPVENKPVDDFYDNPPF